MFFALSVTTRLLAPLLLYLLLGISSQAQSPRSIHVFVALADNQHQGIVPVPAKLGNGLDPTHNLYWGAAAGVKTFFVRSSDWTLLNCREKPTTEVLERCVFQHHHGDVYLVADAYRGDAIQQAIVDFLSAATGANPESITLALASRPITLTARGGANLVAYVGHDGLMDFRLPSVTQKTNAAHRDAIILACASKQYFA